MFSFFSSEPEKKEEVVEEPVEEVKVDRSALSAEIIKEGMEWLEKKQEVEQIFKHDTLDYTIRQKW